MKGSTSMAEPLLCMRLDKWLWCARFYKTRPIAADEIGKGRVQVNGQAAKAASALHAGDTVALRQGNTPRTVVVKALARVRGPASVAQQLYEETPQSLALRSRLAEQRRLAPEPALASPAGRPTKRDRRAMEKLRRPPPRWGDRWNASIDT